MNMVRGSIYLNPCALFVNPDECLCWHKILKKKLNLDSFIKLKFLTKKMNYEKNPFSNECSCCCICMR